MDEAWLYTSKDFGSDSTEFFMQSTECYKCPLKKINDIPSYQIAFLTKLQTKWPIEYKVKDQNETICSRTFHFREYANYTLYVREGGHNPCSLVYMKPESWDYMTPLYILFAVLMALGIIAFIIKFMRSRNCFSRCWYFIRRDNGLSQDLGSPHLEDHLLYEGSRATYTESDQSATSAKISYRLRSLDTFRGISLIIMIFVNYGGGGYWFFHHSPWNGLTVADLVFPWFVFIMGTSAAISFKRMHRGEVSKIKMLRKIVLRTINLFILGIVLNSSKCSGNLQNLRIPGVLQRLAIVYFFIGILEIVFSKPIQTVNYVRLNASSTEFPHDWQPSVFADLCKIWRHLLIILALIAVHCCVTFLLIVPGCGAGYVGPGGLHLDESMFNCTGGAAGYIDRSVFGDNHIYKHPTCMKIYHNTIPYDPEGLLGSLTTISLCFMGLWAGKIFLIYTKWSDILKRFLFWSILTTVIALILCKGSQESGWIPINKNLWSLSFILINAGMSFIILSFLYVIIDVLNVWRGAPFFYPGMNSIFIYVCHEVFKDYFPISWSVPNTHSSQLCMDLWGTVLWVLVSYLLYRKKIFINL